MNSKTSDSPHNDEISQHLDAMYDELMLMRLNLGELRKQKAVTEEEKKAKAETIAEQQELIDNLNADFKEMLKNHTDYWKYKKSIGQNQTSHSEALIAKLKQVKSNMGNIVSTVPSNKQP